MSSILKQASHGALWLGAFKSVSQIVSWGSTIIIARILSPESYGLMEMATVLTGYLELFIELGLGAAIIQKREINKESLSSLFWFLLTWGIILAVSCLGLAPITAALFNEPQIIPLTQSVGILFLLSSIVIIPRSLLHRELKFKEVGAVEAISVVVSSLLMVYFAKNDFGVWTLLLGHISREFIRTGLIFYIEPFYPSFIFSRLALKEYLNFGTFVVAANSFRYLYFKADRFFAGRVFGGQGLGHYSLALQLAALPQDKIVSIINSVSFPLFSKSSHALDEMKAHLLKVLSLTCFITAPIFFGGMSVAYPLFNTLLGEKWAPAILPFQILCIGQFFISLGTPIATANYALGKPKLVMLFHALNLPIMAVAFYFAAHTGSIGLIALPWAIIFPIAQIWLFISTATALQISLKEFFDAIIHPILASIIMCGLIFASSNLYYEIYFPEWQTLLAQVAIGFLSYLLYFIIFKRLLFLKSIEFFLALRNKESE